MRDNALAAGDALLGGSSMQCQSAGGKATGLRATLWCRPIKFRAVCLGWRFLISGR